MSVGNNPAQTLEPFGSCTKDGKSALALLVTHRRAWPHPRPPHWFVSEVADMCVGESSQVWLHLMKGVSA
jgi:hypothetical protein